MNNLDDLKNIYSLFLSGVSNAGQVAVFGWKEDGKWKTMNFQEASKHVLSIATALSAKGFKAGDKVAIFSGTRTEWCLADLAILACGGVTVPIYPSLTGSEAQFILEDSASRFLFVDTLDKAAELQNLGIKNLESIFCFEGQGEAKGTVQIDAMPKEITETPADSEWDLAGRNAVPNDLATIIYTSGTTARPKGVMLSHENILSNVRGSCKLFPMDPGAINLLFLPLAHGFARTCGYYVMLAQLGSIYFAESVEAVPANLQEVKPQVFIAVPRLFEKIYAKITAAAEEGSAITKAIASFAFSTARKIADADEEGSAWGMGLRIRAFISKKLVFGKIQGRLGGKTKLLVSGGAPLAPDIARFFYGVGLPISEGYGLTETSPVICGSPMGSAAFGTVGPPISGVTLKIAEDGEILCKGPNIMKGYLNLPESTAETIVDGWFHTGDIGEIDKNGNLKITGRKKSLIVLSNGKKVVPNELENCLKQDPMMLQIVPWGNNLKFMTALVVVDMERLARGLDRTAAETLEDKKALVEDPAAIDFVQKRIDDLSQDMTPYKRIKKIYLHPEELTQEAGELTPTLKVKMRVIEKKYRKQMENLYKE